MRLLSVSVFVIVAMTCVASRGSIFDNHTRAYTAGSGSSSGTHENPGPSFYQDVRDGVLNAAYSGPYTFEGTLNGHQVAYARAVTNDIGFRGLFRLSATSDSNYAGLYVPPAYSYAAGAWKDVITLSGPLPPPAYVRLTFVVNGIFSIGTNDPQSWYGPYSIASLGIYASDSPNFVDFPFYGMDDSPNRVGMRVSTRLNADGSSTNYINGLTHGELGDPDYYNLLYSFDVPYNSNYGGYAWCFEAAIETECADGFASAFFGQTIGLTAVTNVDGTPLTGYDMSFDSGLTLNEVPEPSTLALWSLGGLVGGFVTWRKRKQ